MGPNQPIDPTRFLFAKKSAPMEFNCAGAGRGTASRRPDPIVASGRKEREESRQPQDQATVCIGKANGSCENFAR